MLIDLLRHGEPEGGLRYRGCGCNDPLSAFGWQQMTAALQAEPVPYAEIWTSPLLRCWAFAEQYASTRRLPLNVIDAWQEIGFGVWEGLTPTQVRQERAAEYRAFRADPVAGRPPGAETAADFRQRVLAAWCDRVPVPSDAVSDSRRILLVAHAGVIRLLVGAILEAPDATLSRLDCAYASRSRLLCEDDRGWRVGFCNRVPSADAEVSGSR